MITETIKKLMEKLRGGRKPPVIPSLYGPVTESARLQAAINMKLDPVKRHQVEQLLVAQCGGSQEAGLKRAREWYPEAYE